ncbi:YggS family pyridoxal phosphate-dependent enzyme [Neoactinobaculum massilliense]|uniref:YggS family pyridoxal phosphate-dependent enzyme n=1 Tax=Neoactinobaculum massilliense TaxID=2364794 RepID=UPI000F52DE03|nr:YggS family pyridoxal phosphate-dependent enzyme [Neoactinobaculum massilliense]
MDFSNTIPSVEEIPARLTAVVEDLRGTEDKLGLPVGTVRLELAVKYQSVPRIRAALDHGGRFIGHNILQQLEATESELTPAGRTAPEGNATGATAVVGHDAADWNGQDATAPARAGEPPHWTHVIGHVQSNKAAIALEWADCIETLDSARLARRLDRLQGERMDAGLATGPFSVYIQVNSSGAESQYGVTPDDALWLADTVADLPHLRLAGLMTIGAHTEDPSDIAASFRTTRQLRDRIRGDQPTCTELSMGMTQDLEIAVAEGSTVVRIGRAVFGPRPRP